MGIRAVFFDLGGVIVHTEYQAPRQRLAEQFSMDYDDIEKIVFGSASAAHASVGEITEGDHWLAIMKTLKLPPGEQRRVQHEFFGGDVIDRTLLEFVRSLKPKYKTGLISNAWSGLREFILREKFDDAFDQMIISAEVKTAKPSAKIFQVALERMAVKPREAVFVDDFIENIEGCEKVGMKGIHFTNPESTIEQLKTLL